ncbi:MAG: 16S rRNA (cytosine(967)-C(5))-methyltransferase RsmB [Oscillospiraceae bacterium]
MAKSAREAALSILERCRRKQAFSDALLSSVVKDAGLGTKDSALTAKLCYGVLQNMALCDFYIDCFTSAKAQKPEPKVRDILRISVYQILFLDRIPAHAAVSEGVNLCKICGFSRASGYVNAILRKVSVSRDKLPKIPMEDKTEYLSIKFSTPKPLTALLVSEFGFDFTEKLLEANNLPAPMTIQVNTLKTTTAELSAALEAKGISCKPHEFLQDCLEISETGDLGALDEHKMGLFYVQDAAARLAILAADPKPGAKVLDACAAPGGKSFSAAIMMKNSGSIMAHDIHANKLQRVSDGAKQLGIDIIKTENMDATHPFKSLISACDLVLADVPCSGLGVIRKKPDIRYKDISETERLPETQLAILEGLAPCVRPGGVLLYSTCTILSRENGGVIASFLALHPEFSAEAFELPQPIGNVLSGMITLFPQLHNTDGFFICKLRKQNES